MLNGRRKRRSSIRRARIASRQGDLISWQTAGAGGAGNPLARKPEAVLRDVRNDFVSIEGAARDYGVVIDPKRRIVDAAATDALRRRLAAAAKTRAARTPAKKPDAPAKPRRRAAR